MGKIFRLRLNSQRIIQLLKYALNLIKKKIKSRLKIEKNVHPFCSTAPHCARTIRHPVHKRSCLCKHECQTTDLHKLADGFERIYWQLSKFTVTAFTVLICDITLATPSSDTKLFVCLFMSEWMCFNVLQYTAISKKTSRYNINSIWIVICYKRAADRLSIGYIIYS